MAIETPEVRTDLPPNEAPPAPMQTSHVEHAEPVPARRGPRGLTLALLLIGGGVALLLHNLGIITLDWPGLLRFWPVLLILVGLEVMLGRRSFLGSLSIVLLGVALVTGVIFFSSGIPSGDAVTRDFSHEVGDVESLQVDLNLGAGNTTVTALTESASGIQATYTTGENAGRIVEYTTRDGVGYLTTSAGNNWFRMAPINDLTLSLPSGVPVDLTIDAGAGNTSLDLTGIQLRSLDVSSGVGNLTVILPDQGSYTVTVSGGVGNVDITLPQGFAAQVEVDSGLGNVNVDAEGLAEVDHDLWQTADFEDAVSQADIEVAAGIGNISIGN
jgi:hypothetical protein